MGAFLDGQLTLWGTARVYSCETVPNSEAHSESELVMGITWLIPQPKWCHRYRPIEIFFVIQQYTVDEVVGAVYLPYSKCILNIRCRSNLDPAHQVLFWRNPLTIQAGTRQARKEKLSALTRHSLVSWFSSGCWWLRAIYRGKCLLY